MPRIAAVATAPLTRGPSRNAVPTKTLHMGQGALLSNLCLALATVVAFCTYNLNQIANSVVYLGFNAHMFDSYQWNVPVFTLLEATSSLRLNTSHIATTGTISLSDLLYKACGIQDTACANAFAPEANKIWYHVGLAFRQIPDFDTPRFQDEAEDIRFQHVNSLSGWNKALVQYYIPNYETAITCMTRRANNSINGNTSRVDTLAFCSHRAFDPKWRCENDVPLDTPVYVVQLQKATAIYMGSLHMRDVYLNGGATAVIHSDQFGHVLLGPVPSVEEYQAGIVQASTPWDILCASRCYDYNPTTRLGWLLELQGRVSLRWESSFLMLTNAIFLWCAIAYFAILQWLFAKQSQISLVAVCLSKNILGISILFVTFWGNTNLQTLTTYFAQNDVRSTQARILHLCGPAQVASIVGIMTGPFIQLCFTPRVVTQTWLLTLFSLLNFCVIFALEALTFPYMNKNVPGPCGYSSSTNCIHLTAIPVTYYLSAVMAAAVVVVAAVTIHLHARWLPESVVVPPTHSMLEYLSIQDLRDFATSGRGCVSRTHDGDIVIDHGILVMKNMLRVTNTYLTRIGNAQYGLLFSWCVPRAGRRFVVHKFRTILVVHIEQNTITRRSYYVPMHCVHVDGDEILASGIC
ncbi:hypothetical protein SDRG_08628 [Saprolegnia diclina VS20]|uniref:Uncharacterized protein n=1 Tax=Saprolegnia diclina (strain VS20) TaxID=1156394 RepID=T0RU65_SAPDV|nr:hypothetical protein SDRG_08628 [Saprolegnia diclina VS20]EQC33947.1 hypothetical protein SDRG_08628 [Saprolegnia diclina VS20]|eukprot:XP_008612742.1 hypothetical protein SDRG_08628 [Saprolegnia diclina VS20]